MQQQKSHVAPATRYGFRPLDFPGEVLEVIDFAEEHLGVDRFGMVALWRALEDALEQIQRASISIEGREALGWVFQREAPTVVRSFDWYCSIFRLDADGIRDELVSMPSLAEFVAKLIDRGYQRDVPKCLLENDAFRAAVLAAPETEQRAKRGSKTSAPALQLGQLSLFDLKDFAAKLRTAVANRRRSSGAPRGLAQQLALL